MHHAIKEPAQKASSSVAGNLAASKKMPSVPVLQQKSTEDEPLQGKFIVQKAAMEDELHGEPVSQRAAIDDEPLQGKFVAQKAAIEEEPFQGKFVAQKATTEEEPLQGKFVAQKAAIEEESLQAKFVAQKADIEEDPLQGKFVAQRAAIDKEPMQGKFNPIQKKENNTGLPDNLKSGIENLSGYSMDDVKVHYNSAKPAGLQAHAYAQGTDIHVAPGQEQHLPHEAWHVVQQKQGRVKPTLQMKSGIPVNDDAGLENEADVMGAKAIHAGGGAVAQGKNIITTGVSVLQRKTRINHHAGEATLNGVTGKVGVKMSAVLDPSDPVRGSATNPAEDVDGLYGGKNQGICVRGHLLNHDLGGFGVAENLYPICDGANARHSMLVEQKVKRALFEAHKHNATPRGKKNKRHVEYEVNVLGTPAHSQFDCVWSTNNSKGVVDNKQDAALIESKLKMGDNYFPAGHEIGLDHWSHVQGNKKRRGKKDFDNHRKKITIYENGVAGPIDPDRLVTEISEEQMAEQRAWALAHPKELSKEDKEWWLKWNNEQQKQESLKRKLEAIPIRLTRNQFAALENMEDDEKEAEGAKVEEGGAEEERPRKRPKRDVKKQASGDVLFKRKASKGRRIGVNR